MDLARDDAAMHPIVLRATTSLQWIVVNDAVEQPARCRLLPNLTPRNVHAGTTRRKNFAKYIKNIDTFVAEETTKWGSWIAI